MTATTFDSTASQDAVLSHPWQDAGLGVAPFSYVATISLPRVDGEEGTERERKAALQTARSLGVSLGSCEVCGECLVNNCVVRDAQGRHFIVGTSCVQRTGDTSLITAAEAAKRQAERDRRRAKVQARIAAELAQFHADQEAQRERNGGLTDHELEIKKTQDRIAESAWLQDILRQSTSLFAQDVCRDLETGRRTVSTLPDRCLAICAEIYAKTESGSRRGSKSYAAAVQDFWAKARA